MDVYVPFYDVVYARCSLCDQVGAVVLTFLFTVAHQVPSTTFPIIIRWSLIQIA